VKIKALIIGDGETREALESYIESKNLKDHFIFTSWIREVDIALAGLDLVSLTSKNEGTPVSLIEAQAAGKFIITTNVGGIKDILHPDCGFLSEREDYSTYKENLLKAVSDFEKLNQKAQVAREKVIEKFSYTRLCRDMDQLYKKLLKKD
jgi:glycosyltransferase involved in cell wall biosynthesis